MDRFCFTLDECDSRMAFLKTELASYHSSSGRLCYIFSPNVLLTPDIVSGLTDGAVVFYGRKNDDAALLFEKKGLTSFCMLNDEEFAAKNAILTAEATLSILIDRSPLALGELTVLIVGFGRIGAALANYLCRLGVRTTIATSASPRPARAFSERAIPLENLDFAPYDAVINTVPAQIAKDQQLLTLKPKALFIELASSPSINLEFANYVGADAAQYPALPTKYSPQSAARIIKEFMMKKLDKLEYYHNELAAPTVKNNQKS